MNSVTGGPRPTMPATVISWEPAARFVNWLNTSQGFQSAYKFLTQPGDSNYRPTDSVFYWTDGEPGYNADNRIRNSLARYFLPSLDEWYKSAYYDPDANGGMGQYWDFPTGSNEVPTAISFGTEADTSVFNQMFSTGPLDIDNAGGLSPYGVMGMGGNVWEWEESEFYLLNPNPWPSHSRGIRGGSWDTVDSQLSASKRSGFKHGYFDKKDPSPIGFRIASIPEPSSAWKTAAARKMPSAENIVAFAEAHRIHPAIPAGRIRRERNDYKKFSNLVGSGAVRKFFA